MPTVKDLTNLMEQLAPKKHIYFDADNVGFLVGDQNAECTTVIVCLDATNAVIDEAIKEKAQLIISHHPFIFYPLKSVTTNDLMGQKIIKAIKHGISIYSAHTNLDFSSGGINEFVATLYGVKKLTPIDPYIDQTQGAGRIGELDKSVSLEKFAVTVKKELKENHVRILGDLSKSVKRVAVINGSGGAETKIIDACLAYKTDCLVTAEVKHHVAIYAKELGLSIIETSHFNSEHIYIEHLTQKLGSLNKGVKFVWAKSESNPFS